MKEITYVIKIPIPNTNNYTETNLNTREEICEFLNITKTGFYSIINKKMKYSHKSNKHLEGIIIEKIETITPITEIRTSVDKELFLNKLIAKINNTNNKTNEEQILKMD